MVCQAEQTLRQLRRKLERACSQPRALVAEIATILAEQPGLTTPEIGKAIRAREGDVRRVLREHPERFQTASSSPDRSPRAKSWILASVSSPTQPDTRAESLEVQRG